MHLNDPVDQWYSMNNREEEENKFHRDQSRGAFGDAEARKNILIDGHSSGITNKRKASGLQHVVPRSEKEVIGSEGVREIMNLFISAIHHHDQIYKSDMKWDQMC